mmetsp:Transcript_917/g.1800  ORF Transcript_917/g.1800 Transcript_917/m.1800 type:complete len:159 (+) Transcript_917:98-574(+)
MRVPAFVARSHPPARAACEGCRERPRRPPARPSLPRLMCANPCTKCACAFSLSGYSLSSPLPARRPRLYVRRECMHRCHLTSAVLPAVSGTVGRPSALATDGWGHHRFKSLACCCAQAHTVLCSSHALARAHFPSPRPRGLFLVFCLWVIDAGVRAHT